jgi:hypothetical protein
MANEHESDEPKATGKKPSLYLDGFELRKGETREQAARRIADRLWAWLEGEIKEGKQPATPEG